MAVGRGGLRLVVAAGGTGGHVYPALAVARELLARRPEAEVIFAGSARGLESRLVSRAGFRLETLRVGPLKGGSLARKLKSLFLLPLGLVDAWRLLRRLRPQVVLGVGGYVSGPLLAVAALGGIPTLLLEPNATVGLANRWLSRLVDAAALGWEEAARQFGKKGFLSGNPVREEIARVPARPAGREVRLLVFGGSQGSHALNEAMVAALPYLVPHRERLRVTHQTGESDLERVRAAYREQGFSVRVEPYLEAMAREYAESDLVVARAGATTCAELAAAGRPAILVPLPAAADDHQRRNAQAMERAGAARLLLQSEISGEQLARALLELVEEPRLRERMAAAARSLARPEAARVIVDRLLELAGGEGEARS